MGDKYKGLDISKRIPTASYYRLDLHNLLPDVDRILYMDGDTAVFQDLSDLITLNMKGNYILGFQDSSKPNILEYYNIKNATVLCAGVLLMDLAAFRKNNITGKFNEFLNKYKGKIYQHDQTTINVVCQGKLSTLPYKYGMWNYKFFRELTSIAIIYFLLLHII
jgi:lipopolysaccharide biosynthesis glycosyltransferase